MAPNGYFCLHSSHIHSSKRGVRERGRSITFFLSHWPEWSPFPLFPNLLRRLKCAYTLEVLNREGDWKWMNDGSATQSVCQREKCMSTPQLIFGTLATLSQHWILGWDPYILGLSLFKKFPITFWGDYLLRISNHFKSVISCQCFCK